MVTESTLRRQFTGMVAASLVVEPDVQAGSVRCDRCAEDADASTSHLRASDRVTATVTCYEGHSWELLSVLCPDHAVDSVAEGMGVSAEDQAVIRATLEPTGYHDPTGEFHPNALTLGDVEILDVSSAGAGYDAAEEDGHGDAGR